ncbi:MAG: peptidylprolyl isomerase [Acidobacteriia bacterium]|nr:peptidylprolyl isomerase [Terriglobia bacterium]
MLVRSLMLIAATLPLAGAADVRIVEEIVAKVNGDIITRGELEHARQQVSEALAQQGVAGARLTEAAREQEKNALRDQIDQLLLVQRGKDLNLNVDADLTRRLAQYQSQSQITDPDKFHDYIRQQTGMTYEDFRDQMKNSMLTQKVIGEEISSRMSVPEADLKKYYDEHQKEFVREEQVFLSQIVISTDGKTPEQAAAAQKKATELVAMARKGENFADLARKNSDDPVTAKDGGQLPPYKRSEHLLDKELEDLVFQQKKGYVTDPIKRPTALLILRVDERFEAGQATFEEVKNDITEKLEAPKMEPKVREYLTRLREDAYLQIKDGYTDSGAAPGKDTRWQDAAQLKPETTTKEEVAARRKRRLLKIIPLPGGRSSVGAAPPAAAAPPVKP